jgi:hypothetical protein
MATVTVGCRLPNGLVLQVGEQKVEIAGQNSGMGGALYLTPAMCGYTDVDESFWAAWLKDHADQEYVKNGAVFAESNQSRAKAKQKDLKDTKTGLEGVDQEGDGITLAGK